MVGKHLTFIKMNTEKTTKYKTNVKFCRCHALTLVIFVFFIIWLGQGVTRVVCVVFILSRVFCMFMGFSSLGIFMSMVAWIGSQSEAAVYRCL